MVYRKRNRYNISVLANMKTAIIKTTFWDDEEFENLNLDSKILYFYLLANPTRTLHRIIKLNNKICSAHTGLSIEQIQIAKKGLEKNKLVIFKERYYLLLKDFVEAKKGRFTQNVIDREDKEIPEDVKKFFKNYTGIIPVYKDIDKDNNKDKENNNFQEFWDEYPQRRVDKEKCKKKFLSFKEELQKQIIEDVKNRKQNDNKWIKGYVPQTTTYLNNKKWEDDLEKKQQVFSA